MKSHARLRRSLLAGLLALLVAPAVGASALTPLPEETHINQSLMAGVVGDEIRKHCPTISARMLVAWFKLEELKRYALNKGYGRAEIKAFIKNPEQKARVKAMAQAYLQSHGVRPDEPGSYCRLGEAEIARKSLIGVMLRAK